MRVEDNKLSTIRRAGYLATLFILDFSQSMTGFKGVNVIMIYIMHTWYVVSNLLFDDYN